MISPAGPHRAAAPKTLAQQQTDFTAEGAPAPDPLLPEALKPAGPKKTMPQTPAPHAGALGHLLSRSRR